MRAIVLTCLLAGVLRPQDGAATSRCAPLLPGTAEGGWREARGDPGNAGVSHGRVPRLDRVAWRFIADSGVMTSPAVDGGAVIFGSTSGRLYAVRTKDGSKIWERLHAGPGEDPEAPHGFTFSAPLVHDGRIYVGSEDGHLYCVARETGDLVWRRHLGGAREAARIWASPKTDGARVYLGSNAGALWAFDARDGRVAWRAWIGTEIGASVGILGSLVLVPARDKLLHALDAATGDVLWSVDVGGTSKSTPAIQDGLAFLRVAGGRVVGVDLVSRSVRFTALLPHAWDAQTSVAHDGERAYATNGPLAAAVAGDGSVAWVRPATAAFDASPVVIGGRVLLAGNDRKLTLLEGATGAVVRELLLGEKLVATPAVVDGVVYAPSATGIVFAVE